MTIQDVRTPEEALADPLFMKDGCVAEINDPETRTVRQVVGRLPHEQDRSRRRSVRRGDGERHQA